MTKYDYEILGYRLYEMNYFSGQYDRYLATAHTEEEAHAKLIKYRAEGRIVDCIKIERMVIDYERN